MEVEVVKFDNLGRGIAYLNDKIIFIPKSVPGDILHVEITSDNKKFLEGKIIDIIKPSKLRKEAICPYFNNCGGCDLMHISLSEALDYKLRTINDVLKQNKISYEVKDIIKNNKEYNYRNKVTLKIENDQIGYYASSSHDLVPINYCYLVKEEINHLIKDLPSLNIHNGSITIRCNYKNELLLIITSDDEINIDGIVEKYVIAGIILNDKVIYGDSFFIEKIGDYLFKVSYNSFFQVNPFICEKLFNLIKENTKDSKNVLDLYCGVGTLSIVAASNSEHVLGVEIIANAVKDANLNKLFNQLNNLEFICADTNEVEERITNEYDTIILDPPRSGVSLKVINKIKEANIKKIIYVSCNPSTLGRDLNLLSDYKITQFTLLDMFVNSKHIESLVVLEK